MSHGLWKAIPIGMFVLICPTDEWRNAVIIVTLTYEHHTKTNGYLILKYMLFICDILNDVWFEFDWTIQLYPEGLLICNGFFVNALLPEMLIVS